MTLLKYLTKRTKSYLKQPIIESNSDKESENTIEDISSPSESESTLESTPPKQKTITTKKTKKIIQ